MLLVITTVAFSSCYRVKPSGNQESVLIYQPYFFGHGGVEPTPVASGSEWCACTTDHVEFSLVPINTEEKFELVVTKDNTPVTCIVNIQTQVIKGQTPELYKKYGTDWYNNNVAPYFRTSCRNEIAKYELFELAAKRETTTKIEQVLLSKMQDYIKKLAIPIQIEQIAFGGVEPPKEVVDETKKTAAQNQAIITQKSRADAELSRKQAEENKAIADKAYQTKMGMTIDEYMALRKIEIEKEKVELIKDHGNVTVIFGNASPTFPTTK